MFILPFRAELRLAQIPYITYAVMLICVLIFFYQNHNEKVVINSILNYCFEIKQHKTHSNRLDELRHDEISCVKALYAMSLFGVDDERFWPDGNADKIKAFELARGHYLTLVDEGLPGNVKGSLMYYPDSLNPIKMLTSTLAHDGWLHIIGNLIFFFAFAPAVEIIIDNKAKYIGILLGFAAITSLTYSITCAISGNYVPTLGLSGSVMGAIGLAAFLMPKARIRTLLLIVVYPLLVSIPVWILAAGYIGWDAYDLFTRPDSGGGVNLVAHVSGGVAGYLFGQLFFREQRDMVREELADEIEYMRAERADKLGVMSSYTGSQERFENEQRLRQAKLEQARLMEQLHRLVNAERDSEAIMIVLADYDLHSQSTEIYEDLFAEIGAWQKRRLYFCVARLLIVQYMSNRKYNKALEVIETCFKKDREFALPDAKDVYTLADMALMQHRFILSCYIAHNYIRRYRTRENLANIVCLEARVLWQHLNKKNEAIMLLNAALQVRGVDNVQKIQTLLELI